MTTDAPELPDGRALVTGASRRLGRAIAERLGRAGCDVVVHYRNDRAGAEQAVQAIRAMGRRATAIQADLADPEDCARLAAEAGMVHGPLTLLVNNAAIFVHTPLDEMTVGHFDEHMAANARSVYLLSLHVGRAMKAGGGGAIVNLADVAGERPWAGYVPYSASKAAAISLTKGFAKALAPAVRVNAIAPGPMLPPAGETPEQGEKAVRSTLLGRWGGPADVAEAVVFLATASYVTGTVLAVDGGRSLV